MFRKNRYIRQLEAENKVLREENRWLNEGRDNSNIRWKKECSSIKRIKSSEIIFEKTVGMENLYVDDKLETNYYLVLYDSKTSIENSMTKYLSRDVAERMTGITVIGYLEMEYWDWKRRYIDVSKLYVAPQYRRKGYATKILNRLIECAAFYDVKRIKLTARASRGIRQEDLEELYHKCGFVKEIEYGNSMIYEFK